MLVTNELHDRTLLQNKYLIPFAELIIIFNLIDHTSDVFSFIYSSRVIIFDEQKKWKRKQICTDYLGFKTCTLWLSPVKKRKFSYKNYIIP